MSIRTSSASGPGKGRDDFLMPEIDFAALKAKNEDFRYWLYIPALEVNYLVVRERIMTFICTAPLMETATVRAAFFWMQAIPGSY